MFCLPIFFSCTIPNSRYNPRLRERTLRLQDRISDWIKFRYILMQEKLQFRTFSVPLRISVCKQVTKNLLLYVFSSTTIHDITSIQSQLFWHRIFVEPDRTHANLENTSTQIINPVFLLEFLSLRDKMYLDIECCHTYNGFPCFFPNVILY